MTELAPYPLPFYMIGSPSFEVEPRTLRELEMIACSAHIREKHEWYLKMSDPEIVGKWRREATSQGLTEAQVDYVVAELDYYAALRDERTGIEVSAVDGVWQSETLIDDDLRNRLCAAARALEDVSDEEKDWHPGSNGQVLDLVHPSLFCLVRDVSGGPEEAWQNPAPEYAAYEFSERFQWLPTDVRVGDDCAVDFTSYVNNVHPEKHRELAEVLPELFARMLPLFENVLTDLRFPRPHRIEIGTHNYWYPDEPEMDYGKREDYPDEAAYFAAYNEAATTWAEWWETSVPVVPDAPQFTAPVTPDGFERVDLRDRDLQVIVKLATIHLTPDNPDYDGGSWHVEGMLNERIVSTGIYYWDSENITESRLAFRTAVEEPWYESRDDKGVRAVYGLEDEDAMNQELGAALTSAGRALAFPNILQHRVGSFRLADPTRPGYRKILAFFVVDPSERIVSTADIPPQQPWASTSTMTLEHAKVFRDELMRERKCFVTEHNGEVYERWFSLCEH